MTQFEIEKQSENDDLVKRLHNSVKQERTPEEKRAQRISWCLSIVDDPDEETIKEVERLVDEVYG